MGLFPSWHPRYSRISSLTSRPTDLNRQDGQGEDSHQHRGHWPRRLWQVDHHRPLDLPMRWHRQEDHREVREGGPGDGQGLLKYAWVLDKLKAERERGIT